MELPKVLFASSKFGGFWVLNTNDMPQNRSTMEQVTAVYFYLHVHALGWTGLTQSPKLDHAIAKQSTLDAWAT